MDDSHLDGTIYGAAVNAVKYGIKRSGKQSGKQSGESTGSFFGKVLLFFPKMIWKLMVLMVKLIGSLYYAIFGGITVLIVLVEKLIEKISFIRIFKFLYGDNSYYQYSDSGEMYKGKKTALIIGKIFGTILYIFVGIIATVYRFFTIIINWFSYFKFYNGLLNI